MPRFAKFYIGKILLTAFFAAGMLLPVTIFAETNIGTNPGGTNIGTNPGGTNVGTNPGGTTIGTNPAQKGGLQNPLKDIDSLPELLGVILDAIIQLGTIVLMFAIVYVGFQFVVARGNPEEIKKARNTLLWTVIGGLILLGSRVILAVIEATVAELQI